ncbi:MAG TPA: ABC transporter substrate-binding protein [Terriglobales bacterium]|jgi:iron complex transport system substrate-binding protein|nr:ABC transporter substrate-binding protein [Terriglobales bacterium]
MTADFTPRRIACLQPSATVILECLGLLERVVACTKYCAEVCPEVKAGGRAIVADSWTAKAEQILKVRPDLVIAAVPYQEKALGEILKSGSRFLGLAPRSLADVYGDIAAIAGICGVAERGAQVIRRMQDEIAAVQAKAPAGPRPRVYCEEWGKPLIRSQRWVAELVEAAGGEFVGEAGRRTLSKAVEAEDPDVIVAAWCGAGDRVPLEKIVRERGWQEMGAVEQGRVYCIRDEFLNTPAPTLLRGLAALAAAIHPQHFPAAAGLRAITPPRSTAREHRRRL